MLALRGCLPSGHVLRITERRNRDGSSVAYYALAENIWNAEAGRSEARVVHSFGRADQLDRAALQRLVTSIKRVLDVDPAEAPPARGTATLPEIEVDAVFVISASCSLRSSCGRTSASARPSVAGSPAPASPHRTRWRCSPWPRSASMSLAPSSLAPPAGCPTPGCRKPRASPSTRLYRALDVLTVYSEEIERDVFLRAADLLRLDVDLIFYDTTTAYFEIDEPDEQGEQWAGKLFAPLRQRGHSKEGRDANPQVVIALAVTRDGVPVRSWVLPGNTADVATVARIKADLHAWRSRPLPVRRRRRHVFRRQPGRS